MVVPMPPESSWVSTRSPQHSLHRLPLSVIEALEAGDLKLASSQAPASLPPLTPFLISPSNRGIWRHRLDKVMADPEHAPYLPRVVVYEVVSDSETKERNPAVIVGRMNFHGKPDESGMVEVGYEIDSAHWQKGHAKAAMRIIVDTARATQGINLLRASVVKENWVSRRIVEAEGLRKVGEEVNPRWGLGDIFLLDVSN